MLYKLSSRSALFNTAKYISQSRFSTQLQLQPEIDQSRQQPFFDPNALQSQISAALQHQIELDRPPVIEPKFHHEGQFVMDADKYVIDCSKFAKDNIHPSNPDLCDEMKQKYDDVGLVYLANTQLTNLQAMRALAAVLIPVGMNMEYKGGSNWRNWIEPNVYDTGAPKEAWVHYHHEMAYVGRSPKAVAFCAKTALSGGRGATYASDQVQATEELLRTPFGQKLKEKRMCYVRNLTDECYYKNQQQNEFDVYNHWQKSFGTQDPEEAVEIAEERGLVVEWEWNHERYGRYMKTKYYTDVYEYFPHLDRNILYASVADHYMWFDTWPCIKLLSNEDRPIKITYGDDSDMTQDELRQFVDIYDKYGIKIDWKVGDVAIMCNYRWAHGRPIFEQYEGESRELGVVLGEVFERMGQRDDKW